MRKGFTLIELLVVIAIIAILAAILFPVFARARAKSWEASCLSNVKQITLGILMYTQDYDGFYPIQNYRVPAGIVYGNNIYWVYAIDPYIRAGVQGQTWVGSSYSIWQCPGARIEPAWYMGAYSHYAINVRLSRFPSYLKKDSEVRWPAQTMLITEGKYWHGTAQKWFGWSYSWGFQDGSQRTRYDHNGRANVGFCDGHAKGGTPGQWASGEYRTSP